jgi:hypothetical protein
MNTRIPFLLIATLALGIAAFESGCATVTRGSTEQFLVQSEPSGANVRLSTGQTGITPVSFTVQRKGDLAVSISKDGYESVEVTAPARIAPAGAASVVGNGIFGPCGLIIYGAVDSATGAALAHTPNPVKVTLQPAKPPTPPSSPAAPTADALKVATTF